MTGAVEPVAALVDPEVVAPPPPVEPVVPVVGALTGVVVLPDPDGTGLVLSDVVWTAPPASLVVALADVRLPLASRVYCAVPVPAPQAVSITETPVKAVSESARMAVTSNDTFNIKYFSHVNFVISDKRSHANACVRALLYEKSSRKK